MSKSSLFFRNSLGKQVSATPRLIRAFLKVFGVPHLGTRARLKLLSMALEKISPRPRSMVLDAGCGYAFASIMLSQRGLRVTAVDNDLRRLATAKSLAPETSSLHFLKANLYRLPFRTGSFALCVCLEVLEHVKDDQKVLMELARVTKRGGYLIASFPEPTSDRAKFAKLDHVVRGGYALAEFTRMAERVGYKKEFVLTFGNNPLGKGVLLLDYNLAKISPLLSSLFVPILYPLLLLEWFLPTNSPWNFMVVRQKI